MVYYLSETGEGIERYAEMNYGVTGALESYKQQMKYTEPDKVHPRSLGENVSVRQQGYWVNADTMPQKYLWANGGKPLPDVLPGFVVSTGFRDLVERFEPGVHQYVPAGIFRSREGEPVARYYWFIVGQRLDSVDRERTTFNWKAPVDDPQSGYWPDREMDKKTFKVIRLPDAKLVFSNQQIAGNHIWHDPHLLTFGNGLCSDVFAEAVSSSGMTGVTATPPKSA